MKKIVTGILAFAGILTMGTAQAKMDINPFVKANLGYSIMSEVDVDSAGLMLDIDAEDNAIYGISAGVTFNKKHDVEFEYARAEYDLKKISGLGVTLDLGGEMNVDSYMINYRYIFNTKDEFRPYLLGGIGAKDLEGSINFNGSSFSGSDSVFAYQVGLGGKYFLNDNVYLDLSYRYQGSDEFKIEGDKYELNNHNFVFGVAYQW